MESINVLAAQICAIQNQMIPDEGPKTIPLDLDFDTADTIIYNALMQQQTGKISIVQTLWVDTSLGAPLIISCGVSGQVLNIPANRNGYVNVLLPGTIELRFISAIGSFARVQLINVPIAGHLWETN